MPTRISISDSRRLTIAGKQRFRWANSIDPTRVPCYTCPFSHDGGSFDESCFEIDHILELASEGSNDDSNLQALCICCHRVKTRRFNSRRRTTEEEEEEENPITEALENFRQEIIGEINVMTTDMEMRSRRSPKDMEKILVNGQIVYSDYAGMTFSAVYCSETNTLDVGERKYESPSAFRKSVVNDENHSGKGWQRCYVKDKNGAHVKLEDLPIRL